MIKWTPYIYVRFVVFLIAGICSYYFSGFFTEYLLGAFLGLILLYGILVWLIPPKKMLFLNPLMGILSFSIIYLFGWLHTYSYTAIHQKDHIIHLQDSVNAYIVVVKAEVQNRKKTFKTEVSVQAVKSNGQWKKASGKILLHLYKSSSNTNSLKLPFQYGDKLLILGNPHIFTSHQNPYAFDYGAYLRRQNIYHQHFIQPAQFQWISAHNGNWMMEYAIKARKFCDDTFRRLIRSEREYGLAVALVLGIRDSLDSEVIQAYANTGTTHILAVSGMHIGLIFLFLKMLLKPIQKIKKTGKWSFAIIVLSILWFYAFVTGLSASILRAVVMFSFVVVAEALNKRTSIYNTLGVSAFCLLLYNPFLIFDVGFQLSYLAVLGIIYLYPKFYALKSFRFYLMDSAWGLICVSIAAQIATFPISMFYFHQFPNYFLISNLIIIPISTSALYLGIFTLGLQWIPYVDILIGLLLRWNLWLMNGFTFLIEDFPYSITTGIVISFWETVWIYAIIIYLLLLFAVRKFRPLVYATILMLMLSISQIYQIIQRNYQKILVIYHISRKPNLQLIEGKKAILFADSTLQDDPNAIKFNIQNHLIYRGVEHQEMYQWNQSKKITQSYWAYQRFEQYAILVWHHKSMLIIQKYLSTKQLKSIAHLKVDMLVIQNNSVRDLKSWLQPKNISNIIFDASNGIKMTQQLVQEAKDMRISYYSVHEKGAFLLRLK